MPHGVQKIDVKKCAKTFPPHPCDEPQPPCDPNSVLNDCPKPYLCQEILLNPAWPGEVTSCKPGSFMYAKTCEKQLPPHPCDSKPPCSLKSPIERNRRLPCMYDTPLCYERIKNPDNRKKEDPSCDESQ